MERQPSPIASNNNDEFEFPAIDYWIWINSSSRMFWRNECCWINLQQIQLINWAGNQTWLVDEVAELVYYLLVEVWLIAPNRNQTQQINQSIRQSSAIFQQLTNKVELELKPFIPFQQIHSIYFSNWIKSIKDI